MKQLPESHSPNPRDWHMLNEMDGFMKLGMKSETCQVAQKLLKTRLITAEIFIRTLTTMLAVAKRPKNWKSLVENAYKNLPKPDRQHACEIMLGYYATIKDWDSALRFLPKRSPNGSDLLFSMWTLLELRRMDAAKSLYAKCKKALKHENDRLDNAGILMAMGSYCAQIGDFKTAEYHWHTAAKYEPFIFSPHDELIRLQAGRGLHQIAAAQTRIKEFKKTGTDEIAVSLPGTTNAIIKQTEKQLNRYEKAFNKVIPKKELWRYGLKMDDSGS